MASLDLHIDRRQQQPRPTRVDYGRVITDAEHDVTAGRSHLPTDAVDQAELPGVCDRHVVVGARWLLLGRHVVAPAFAARTASITCRAAALISGAATTPVITATPSAPASMTGAAFSALMPPMPTIGSVTAARISRTRSGPTGAPASALLPRASYTAPTPR